MKRIIIALLCLLISLGLVGCSQETDYKEKLTEAFPGYSDAIEEIENEDAKALYEIYESNPGSTYDDLCYEFLTNGTYAPEDIKHIIDIEVVITDTISGCLISRTDAGSDEMLGMVSLSNELYSDQSLAFWYNVKSKEISRICLTTYPEGFHEDDALFFWAKNILLMKEVDPYFVDNGGMAAQILSDAMKDEDEVVFNGFKYSFWKTNDHLSFVIEY